MTKYIGIAFLLFSSLLSAQEKIGDLDRTIATSEQANGPTQFQTATTPIKQHHDHPKWRKFAEVVGQVSAVAYATKVCGDVEAKPLIYFTADDYELLQACRTNGF
jgi:hypothetical protein